VLKEPGHTSEVQLGTYHSDLFNLTNGFN